MAATAEALQYRQGDLSRLTMAYNADSHSELVTADGEIFGYGTERVMNLGSVACDMEIEKIKEVGVFHEVWTDFKRGIEENLATDVEYGDSLKFDPIRTLKIVNDEVVDDLGVSVLSTVEHGLKKSKEAAEHDPRMLDHVIRDQGEVFLAKEENKLMVGEALVAASMDPKEAIKRDPELWKNLGYAEGMAIFHVFYKISETEMLSGVFSVKRSDPSAMRKIMAELGVNIPEDISEHHWTRYPAKFQTDQKTAQDLGSRIQDRHAKLVGHEAKQISVTEMVANGQETLQGYFDALMIPLAKSRYSGKTEVEISAFAKRLLPRADSFSSFERQCLIRMANGKKFTPEDSRIMESFIRYAVVEELRKQLIVVNDKERTIEYVPTPTFTASWQPDLNPAILMEMLSSNIEAGRQAGRVYLGCSPTGNSSDSNNSSQDRNKSQDKTNKKDSNETGETNSLECEYSGTFCYCCPYNDDGTKAKKLYVVTAEKGRDGVARCKRPKCGAQLDSKGRAKKGYIYQLAMKLQAEQKTKKVA